MKTKNTKATPSNKSQVNAPCENGQGETENTSLEAAPSGDKLIRVPREGGWEVTEVDEKSPVKKTEYGGYVGPLEQDKRLARHFAVVSFVSTLAMVTAYCVGSISGLVLLLGSAVQNGSFVLIVNVLNGRLDFQTFARAIKEFKFW